jgi:hypothetical protein
MISLLALLACQPDPALTPAPGGAGGEGPTVMAVGSGQLVLDPGGWFDLVDADGHAVLVHAVGVAMLDAAGETGTPLRTDDDRDRTVTETADGLELRVQGADGVPDLLWWLGAGEDGALLAELRVDNTTDEPVHIAKLATIRAEAGDGGGLFLGADPARHRILENGSHAALEFVAEVRPGDTEPDAAAAMIAPGEYEGHSVSSSNHAVVDLDSSAAWVAGALSFDQAQPVMNLSYLPVLSDEDDHQRLGFTYFSAEADFLPLALDVAPGDTISSERIWVSAFGADALLGLEAYADAVANHYGIVPWHRREAGRRVPNGWNSWSGSGGTGGYGTDFDEELVLENLDWMALELRDWGMDWFQFDDGYEPTYGEWVWRTDRFPSGPRGLSDAIRERGFRPGIWIAPFTAYDEATVFIEHPDWFIEKTPLGQIVSSGYNVLDLTHPEVQAWLAALMTEVRDEWGFDWVKVDFGYYAMMGAHYDDPSATREAAWRQGVQVVRDALGDDVFLLMVGVLGQNYGLVDSMRTTLDNAPVWDWDPSLNLDNHMEQQGHKPTMRTAGRRWYLHDRVWLNHPDLIIFRSNTRDETWPRVTLEEARAFATFVGLSGGIVKLGDRLLDLEGDAVGVIRALLPTYGTAARPLDVFEREFAEVWHLPVHAPIDGYDASYEVMGLFNWGLNQDLTTSPYSLMEDDGSDRHHAVDLNARGLSGTWLAYEFWTASFLGEVEDTLVLDVPAHDSRVVALRPPTGAPQFLGWNRQITMGGSVLEDATWDDSARTLTLRMPVVPGTELAPFVWEVAVHVPDGFTRSDLQAEGVALTNLQAALDGSVLRISFEPEAAGSLHLVVHF